MILNRYPLSNEKGNVGYFDYSGSTDQFGKTEKQAYSFNSENIETVILKFM